MPVIYLQNGEKQIKSYLGKPAWEYYLGPDYKPEREGCTEFEYMVIQWLIAHEALPGLLRKVLKGGWITEDIAPEFFAVVNALERGFSDLNDLINRPQDKPTPTTNADEPRQ